MKCLFYPNCNRGSNCPFLREGEPKASQAKAPAAKASVAKLKAAVATVIASSSIQGAMHP